MTDLTSLTRRAATPPVRRPPNRTAHALALWLAAVLTCTTGARSVYAQSAARPSGDYIVAIVNQELVTAGELEQRLAQVRGNAARNNTALPPADELRRQVLDALIDERVQVTAARDSGARVDDVELDRAVANVAVQNQITPAQLRDRLRADGVDYQRFRSNLRDQLLVERTREREVQGRIRIGDREIDAWLDRQREQGGNAVQLNVAQILVIVPEGATLAEASERRLRAESAQARVKAGEPFDAVAREMSDDSNKAQGGEIGLRPIDRLPDVFIDQVRNLKAGEVAPALLRTGAGFHLLKVLERVDAGGLSVTQTHARHILLRPSAQLTQDAALRRLAGYRQQIESGARRFDEVAREFSEDGSAAQGGDLGWAAPGMFVPEFEEAMANLQNGGISAPLVSRFGVHLIQVLERRTVALDVKQQREQARNVLREQKYDEAYNDWSRELRARAYIELREAP